MIERYNCRECSQPRPAGKECPDCGYSPGKKNLKRELEVLAEANLRFSRKVNNGHPLYDSRDDSAKSMEWALKCGLFQNRLKKFK